MDRTAARNICAEELLSQKSFTAFADLLAKENYSHELKSYAKNWILNHGEKFHLMFRESCLDTKVVTTEPSERGRNIFRDVSYMYLNDKSTQQIAIDLLLTNARNHEFDYGWVNFIISRSLKSVRRKNVLSLALIADSQIANLFDRLAVTGRISSRDYADAMQLLGAMCLIVHGDKPACLRLWARNADIRASSFHDLDKEHGTSELALQAIIVVYIIGFDILVNVGTGTDKWLLDTPILDSAINTLMVPNESAPDRSRMFHCINTIYYRCVVDMSFETLLTNQLRNPFSDAWPQDAILEHVIKVWINLCGEPDESNSHNLSIFQKRIANPVAKISMAVLANKNVSGNSLYMLLCDAIKHWNICIRNSLDHRLYEELIALLCSKGACYTNDRYLVFEAVGSVTKHADQPIGKLLVNSMCRCYHASSHHDRVLPLYCLSAMKLATRQTFGSRLISANGLEAQISMANGQVAIPISQFINGHNIYDDSTTYMNAILKEFNA